MLRIGLLLSLALCVNGAQAELYKWVDAEGNVQFSNQPPPKDTEAETLELEITAPMESAAPVEAEAAPADETTGEAAPASSGKGITPEQLRQQNCNAAQRNLKIFSGSTEGVMLQGQDGKLYPLTPDQHKTKLAEAQKQVEYYCKLATEQDAPAGQAAQ